MNPTAIRIDQVVIELADGARARDVEPVLRAALERLAARLASTPLARDIDLRSRVLESFRPDALTAEDLLGAGGADRLAESLWQEITHRPARSSPTSTAATRRSQP